jgi:hypothetical protein
MGPLLSVLICSLTERDAQLQRLLRFIGKHSGPEVEVLTEVDNRGMTVGEKRNKLLDRARGRYVAFVDDDDKISSRYFELVLAGCRRDMDCCSLLGLHYKDGVLDSPFEHSLKHSTWERLPGGLYIRPPNHLNAVRREIALEVRFPEISVGEDRDYCLRLREKLKTEHEITEPIYRYNYNSWK